jgi:hypothetical protein
MSLATYPCSASRGTAIHFQRPAFLLCTNANRLHLQVCSALFTTCVLDRVFAPPDFVRAFLHEAMPQLTKKELDMINDTCRKKGTGKDAIGAINKMRKKKRIPPISPEAVYSYIRGKTHQPGRKDKRGNKSILKPRHVKKLMKARVRLIKKTNNSKRVTYADIIREADLDVDPCQKVVEEALREEGVQYRRARAKIQITSGDAEKRVVFAEKWKKKAADFWTDDVDGHHDLKAFPMTLTEAQRLRYAQTKVVGHLRLESEGTEQGFTRPKQNHQWLGIPSVTISAVVSANKLLVWEVVDGNWNGEKAKALYSGPIQKALVREYGEKRTVGAGGRKCRPGGNVASWIWPHGPHGINGPPLA